MASRFAAVTNKENFTNNQKSCSRNTKIVTKFGFKVLTGKDLPVWLELIDETGKNVFWLENANFNLKVFRYFITTEADIFINKLKTKFNSYFFTESF